MDTLRKLILTAFSMLLLSAGVVHADYRETVHILRIGMLDSHPAAADPLRLETVRQAYENVIGIPVEIVRFPRFAALIDAHASNRVQYGLHSALSYVTTQAVCGCVNPLRRAVSANGDVGFRSVLAVDRSVAADPTRIKVAYSSETSVSGWEIPSMAMRSGSLGRPHLVKAGSAREAVRLYAEGKVDGFFAWVPENTGGTSDAGPANLFGGAFADQLASVRPLRAAWLSEPVYNGPHAVHRSLPDDLVAVLANFLDEMPSAAPGLLDILEPVHSGGYAAATTSDYRSIANIVGNGAADAGNIR